MKLKRAFNPEARGVVHILVGLILVVTFANHGFAQTDAGIGTWKLNLAKSKYSPGPAPKNQTRTSVMVGDSVKTTFEGEEANGSHTSYTFTAKYDGKDYPITGTGSPNGADRIALKRVDANTVDATLTRAGKQVMITRRVVSSEGKVLTLMSKGTSPSGQSINAMTVWDKQ